MEGRTVIAIAHRLSTICADGPAGACSIAAASSRQGTHARAAGARRHLCAAVAPAIGRVHAGAAGRGGEVTRQERARSAASLSAGCSPPPACPRRSASLRDVRILLFRLRRPEQSCLHVGCLGIGKVPRRGILHRLQRHVQAAGRRAQPGGASCSVRLLLCHLPLLTGTCHIALGALEQRPAFTKFAAGLGVGPLQHLQEILGINRVFLFRSTSDAICSSIVTKSSPRP